MSFERFFPHKDFRPSQKEAIIEILDSLESYDFFFLEAPTGFGKSAVAYTIQKVIEEQDGNGFICVRDKFLQEQYLTDYEGLTTVKGRGNFECRLEAGSTCADAPCVQDPTFKCMFRPRREPERIKGGVWFTFEGEACYYWLQKAEAIESPLTLQNYAYYLVEQNFVGDFNQRDFGIFDEAHILEDCLMDFVSIQVTRRLMDAIPIYGRFPDFTTIDEWRDWLVDVRGQVASKLKSLKEHEERFGEETKKLYNRLVRAYKNLEQSVPLLNEENWVWTREKEKVVFKPIEVSKFGSLLFGHTKKRLLMSATILVEKSVRDCLGIDEDVKYVKISKSNFPAGNRPFIQRYVGRANFKSMDTYLEKLVIILDSLIIPEFKESKGVIHTHTHRIAKYIMKNSRHSGIMMSYSGKIRGEREEAIKRFFECDPPKIMVSPSMGLGVDLKDDRCRWQVIAKTPYPDLGDAQIRRRADQDREWYDLRTLRSLIQTYGRGCRSPTDYCSTIIMDSSFVYLAKRNWESLPEWFTEAFTKGWK